MEILASVAVVVSCVSTIIHSVIAYKKSKEPPKDVVWETALKLTLENSNRDKDATAFARTYQELQLFVQNGKTLSGVYPLDDKILISLASELENNPSDQER